MEIVIFIFEIFGTAAFAASGVLTAINKKLDLFGAVILGVTTAVGGGVIRDIILGITPPTVFIHPIYAMVAIIVSCIALFSPVRKYLMKNSSVYNRVMFFLDTIGLGIFTMSGVQTACETSADYNNILIVFVGVITGVGGGILRDIFSGNIPYIFIKHIYACASIAGALGAAILWKYIDNAYAMALGAFVIIIIRCLSAHYKWNLKIKY